VIVIHNGSLTHELEVAHRESPAQAHARGVTWLPWFKAITLIGRTGEGVNTGNPPFAVFQARELPLKVEVRKIKEAK
jgi:hypothetical protein